MRRLTIALYLLLVAYLTGFFWHWYTHRPCADVNGKPVLIPGAIQGTTVRACKVTHGP